MSKLVICERRDLQLVAVSSVEDALYHSNYSIRSAWPNCEIDIKLYQFIQLKDKPQEQIDLIIKQLRDKYPATMCYGSLLFAVTVHYEVSVDVNFSPGSNESGLATESELQMASDSEGESGGGFDSQF